MSNIRRKCEQILERMDRLHKEAKEIEKKNPDYRKNKKWREINKMYHNLHDLPFINEKL